MKLDIRDRTPTSLRDAAVWQSIIAALQHGALQNLLVLEIDGCFAEDGNFQHFINALVGSACSKRLLLLTFESCEINVEGACALADHLGRDAFPRLKELRFIENTRITDVGVVALAEALLKPKQTMLTGLELGGVGMGDVGITALSSLVCQGRFEQLDFLNLS